MNPKSPLPPPGFFFDPAVRDRLYAPGPGGLVPASALASATHWEEGAMTNPNYTTSGHARLPLRPWGDAAILAKLYPCFSERIHHRSYGS